jgi:hypothetical protein
MKKENFIKLTNVLHSLECEILFFKDTSTDYHSQLIELKISFSNRSAQSIKENTIKLTESLYSIGFCIISLIIVNFPFWEVELILEPL